MLMCDCVVFLNADENKNSKQRAWSLKMWMKHEPNSSQTNMRLTKRIDTQKTAKKKENAIWQNILEERQCQTKDDRSRINVWLCYFFQHQVNVSQKQILKHMQNLNRNERMIMNQQCCRKRHQYHHQKRIDGENRAKGGVTSHSAHHKLWQCSVELSMSLFDTDHEGDQSDQAPKASLR